MRLCFVSVLHVDTRWDFGRFCCERAKGYQEWFLWKLNSSKVPVFRKAVTGHGRRRNFTGQYFQCRGCTLQWCQVGVRNRGANSEPEEGAGLQETGADEGEMQFEWRIHLEIGVAGSQELHGWSEWVAFRAACCSLSKGFANLSAYLIKNAKHLPCHKIHGGGGG